VGGFGGAEESRGVVRNEARLPAFLEILTRITNQVFVRNERVAEVDQVTGRRAHPDGIPPRRIDLDARIGEIARHHQHCIDIFGRGMTNAAWSSSVDEEDGPLRATGARRKHFVAVDDVTAVDLLDCGAETDRLVRFAGLRLTTPRDPLFAA